MNDLMAVLIIVGLHTILILISVEIESLKIELEQLKDELEDKE